MKKHDYPFLLVKIETRAEQKERSFKTNTITGATAELARAMAKGLVTINSSVSQFDLLAVQKAKDSPWSGRVSIGRARNNDVIIEDASVSKMHAHFVQKDGGWAVIDVQSHNGVRINGTRIPPNEPHSIVPGDFLLFGTMSATWLDAGGLFDFICREIIQESAS